MATSSGAGRRSSFAVVGALVAVTAARDNPIGWIFCARGRRLQPSRGFGESATPCTRCSPSRGRLLGGGRRRPGSRSGSGSWAAFAPGDPRSSAAVPERHAAVPALATVSRGARGASRWPRRGRRARARCRSTTSRRSRTRIGVGGAAGDVLEGFQASAGCSLTRPSSASATSLVVRFRRVARHGAAAAQVAACAARSAVVVLVASFRG